MCAGWRERGGGMERGEGERERGGREREIQSKTMCDVCVMFVCVERERDSPEKNP